MGVVVQGFLENVQAQGVVVAKTTVANDFRPVGSSLSFATFPGALQVTSPPAGKSPESILVDGSFREEKNFLIEKFCANCGDDLRIGETVLSQAEYFSMTAQIDKLLLQWPKVLDIEWLKAGDKIYFVQSRPVPPITALQKPVYVGTPKFTLFRDKQDGDSNDPSILRIRGEIDVMLKIKSGDALDAQSIEEVTYSYRGETRTLAKKDLKIELKRSDEGMITLLIPLNCSKVKLSSPTLRSLKNSRLWMELSLFFLEMN